jgi:transmembrane sensor
MEKDLDENLIAKYFEGTTTEIENDFIENWVNENDNNAKKLKDYKQIWQLNSGKSLDFEPNVNLAWAKVKNRINKKSTVWSWRPIGIAASILLVSIVSYWVFNRANTTENLSLTTKFNAQNIQLADGSKINLNQNSSLHYPKEFRGKERKVKLKGEAFFNIQRNPEKPFIIEANLLNIKVLGTSFNVISHTDFVKVSVKSGRVEVKKSAKDFVVLKAGQEVIYNTKSDSLIVNSIVDLNVFSHYNKVFAFDNTSLTDVAKTISNSYQVKIDIEDESLKKLKLTTKFENQNLDHVLAIITETLLLDIQKDNNTYIFRKRKGL